MANLHEEMPVIFEFQDLTIPSPGSTNPNVIVLVHINAMLSFWPIESFARTAPGLQQVSLRIENEHWRRGEAALRLRRSLCRAQFVDGVQAGTLQNPDVVVAIHGHATHLAHDPV